MKMCIRGIFYFVLICTTVQQILAEDPLTPEQARKLNPETGTYETYFNEITNGKFNIRLHGENGIEIGCVGYFAHEKWFVRNYLTDVKGYHPVRDLNIPFTVIPTSGQSFSIVFIEILPVCGSYYELYLNSKNPKPEPSNQIIYTQSTNPPQTTPINDNGLRVRDTTPHEPKYPITSYTTKKFPTNTATRSTPYITKNTDYTETPEILTGWSTQPTSSWSNTPPSTGYFETPITYTAQPTSPTRAKIPYDTTTVKTPTGYPTKYQPTGPTFKEEPRNPDNTNIKTPIQPQTTPWKTPITTTKSGTNFPPSIPSTYKPTYETRQPPATPFPKHYSEPPTPTPFEPYPSPSSHRPNFETPKTPQPKIPICVPDVPESIEFGSHFSNHVDRPDEVGPEAPFRISLENCKCTCPNAKKIPRNVLKGKTFDLD